MSEVRSSHSHIFKPIGPAVLFEENFVSVCEEPFLATFTFGGVGAVEVGDVLVAYIAKPGEMELVGWGKRARGIHLKGVR